MNLVNLQFGNLLVIGKNEITGLYICKCNCNNICEKSKRYLTRKGHPEIKHCGCKPFIQATSTKDLIGKKFSKLTITSYKEKKGYKHYWNYICDCGVEGVVSEKALLCKVRPTKSCGCLQKEKVTKHAAHSKENNGGLSQQEIRRNNKLNNEIKFNISNKLFGELIVLDTEGVNNSTKIWNCVCSCGELRQLSYTSLTRTSRPTRSCGHLQLQTTHGLTESDEFKVWTGMLYRCNSNTVSNKAYVNYGGRGIKVCDRWLIFENFLQDMGTRPDNTYTIERVNVNGNYEPSNCIWLQAKYQNRNRIQTVLNVDIVKQIRELKSQGLKMIEIYNLLLQQHSDITKASVNSVYYNRSWKDI